MKIKAEVLTKALELVRNCVAKNSTVPANTCVYLSKAAGSLVLRGYDGFRHAEITIRLGAIDTETFEVCVSADLLSKFVPNNAGTIKIGVSKGTRLSLEGSAGEATLPFIPGAEFSPLPVFPENPSQLSSFASLGEGLGKVSWAANTQKSGSIFGAIAIVFGEDTKVLACDGGAVTARATVDCESTEHGTVLILADDASIVSAFAPVIQYKARVGFTENAFFVEADDCSLGIESVRLALPAVSGKFPDVESLMRSSSPLQVVADRKQLQQALEMADLFGDHVFLEFDQSGLSFYSSSGPNGTHATRIAATATAESGAPTLISMSFLRRILLPAVKSSKSPTVVIGAKGDLMPVLITEETLTLRQSAIVAMPTSTKRNTADIVSVREVPAGDEFEDEEFEDEEDLEFA